MKKQILSLFLVLVFLVSGVSFAQEASLDDFLDPQTDEDYFIMKDIVVAEFQEPKSYYHEDEKISLHHKVDIDENRYAVVLEACGAENNAFDEALFESIEKLPAPITLFADHLWLKTHYERLKVYVFSDHLRIANHGWGCRKLTLDQMPGKNRREKVASLYDEIEKSARWVEFLTGELPAYYQAGTGYYEKLGLQIAEILGFQVIEPTRIIQSSHEIITDKWLRDISQGEIISLPANRPGTGIADLYLDLWKALAKRHYRPIDLDEFDVETLVYPS